MRTQRRVGGWGFLADGKRPERTVRSCLELAAEGVGPGSFQPRFRPFAKTATGTRLQRTQQVGQRRVTPGVLGKVGADTSDERVPTDVGNKLLEHRRALGVADAVEVRFGLAQRRHISSNRVRRRQLVLSVAPDLPATAKSSPRLSEPGGSGRRLEARPF